jgi:hypothetical protein
VFVTALGNSARLIGRVDLAAMSELLRAAELQKRTAEALRLAGIGDEAHYASPPRADPRRRRRTMTPPSHSSGDDVSVSPDSTPADDLYADNHDGSILHHREELEEDANEENWPTSTVTNDWATHRQRSPDRDPEWRDRSQVHSHGAAYDAAYLRRWDHRAALPRVAVPENTVSAITRERDEARARLALRYPRLNLSPPSASSASYAGADQTSVASKAPPPASLERSARFRDPIVTAAIDPAATGYAMCPRCDVVAPPWHLCRAPLHVPSGDDRQAVSRAAAEPSPASAAWFAPPPSAVLRSLRPGRSGGAADRPVALPLRHGIDDDVAARLPHEVEPRELMVWSRAAEAEGFRPPGLRPGMQYAQQLLTKIRQVRSRTPPRAVRKPPSPPRPRRSPSAVDNSPRKPSLMEISVPSSRFMTSSSGSLSSAAPMAHVDPPQRGSSSKGHCVWCGQPRKSNEHDLTCLKRRVMCRRCHREVFLADLDRHKTTCT